MHEAYQVALETLVARYPPAPKRRAALVAVALALPLMPKAGVAQELKMAMAADVTSADPHFFNLFPNNNLGEHIFDKLVQTGVATRT